MQKSNGNESLNSIEISLDHSESQAVGSKSSNVDKYDDAMDDTDQQKEYEFFFGTGTVNQSYKDGIDWNEEYNKLFGDGNKTDSTFKQRGPNKCHLEQVRRKLNFD